MSYQQHHVPNAVVYPPPSPNERILTITDIVGNAHKGIAPLVPVSKSTWIAGVATGRFPPAVRVSANRVGWWESWIHQFRTQLPIASPNHKRQSQMQPAPPARGPGRPKSTPDSGSTSLDVGPRAPTAIAPAENGGFDHED